MRKIYIERIKNYKEILKEVETAPLDKTIESFQKDLLVEREIFIWESIAIAYKNYVQEKQGLSLEKKKEVFGVLLGLSTGISDFKGIKLLNDNEIEQLKIAYFG